MDGVEFPMPHDHEAEGTIRNRLSELGVTDDYVVVVPGARWIVKEWPLLNFGELCISADTGPLHIANALKKPLIALFGTTSPHRTGPYGGSHVHLIISPTSKATPEQPLVDDPDCMAQIPVDAVWDVYSEMLRKDL